MQSICYLPGVVGIRSLNSNWLRYITAKICLFFGFFIFERWALSQFSELFTYLAASFRLGPLREKLSCIYSITPISWILREIIIKNQ